MLYQRYLFDKIAKTFAFFLLCIFLIFTLLDLSIHGVRFFSHGLIGIIDIAIYYFYNFANYLEFFLPLTFLLGVLKVVLDLNTHNELVALQMAGLSRKKILVPFFIFAGLLTFVSYANQQWLAPKSQEFASGFRSKHTKRQKKADTPHLFSIPLEDKTELVYQEMNDNELFDVFWIKSSKDLWHMKFLKTGPSIEGRFVDRFQRTSEGKLEKTESFETKAFPDLVLDSDVHLQPFIPFENRPLSLLFTQALKQTSEKQNALCYLHHKLASPMLCFLVLILVTPFIMCFSRLKPLFLITASSLFVFVGFMTVLEGMFILAENHVISSFLAIWGPMLAAFAIGLPRFIKI